MKVQYFVKKLTKCIIKFPMTIISETSAKSKLTSILCLGVNRVRNPHHSLDLSAEWQEENNPLSLFSPGPFPDYSRPWGMT